MSGRSFRYDAVAVTLHWVTAALVVATLLVALRFATLPDVEQGAWIRLHKSIGVTVFVLTLARAAWRLARPPASPQISAFERRVAGLIHAAFYGLLVALPLSGWVMISLAEPLRTTRIWGLAVLPPAPGLPQLAAPAKAAAHTVAAWAHIGLASVFVALLALHVAAALLHSWRRQDGGVGAMTYGHRRG